MRAAGSGHDLRRAMGGALLSLALLVGCGRAIDRPLHGAPAGGGDAGTPGPGVPPTLAPSSALRFRPLPAPSPGIPAPSPSPGLPAPSPGLPASPQPFASPSPAPAPPIVRTIAPAANSRVPAGEPVTISGILIGRGADLASASLTLNGADAGAQIDKRSPRQWSIHAAQVLPPGTYTARVLVRDAGGSPGGFTWTFRVGEDATIESSDP